MNKYKEAVERIKEECSKYHNFDIIDDFIALKELVEKATPKKYVERVEFVDEVKWMHASCPNCKEIIDEFGYYPYCPNCGQSLDWSEENVG